MKHMASSVPAGKSFQSVRSCVLPFLVLLYSLQKLSDFKVHVLIKRMLQPSNTVEDILPWHRL